MMYLPSAILLSIALIFLTILGEIKPEYQKKLVCINGILAFIGILFILSVCFIANHNIYNGGHDEQLSEWAGNMFSIYYQISLPVFFILLAVTVISSVLSFFDKNSLHGFTPKLRVMASCASSVMLLIIAPFYGFMTENETIPLYTYICFIGVGQALTMRLAFIPEYCARIRIHVNKM